MGTVKKKKIKGMPCCDTSQDASSLYLFTEYTHFTQNYTSTSLTDYTRSIGRQVNLREKDTSHYMFTGQNGYSL